MIKEREHKLNIANYFEVDLTCFDIEDVKNIQYDKDVALFCFLIKSRF